MTDTTKLRELLEVATVRAGDDVELAQAAYDAHEELTDTMCEWLPVLLDEIDRLQSLAKTSNDLARINAAARDAWHRCSAERDAVLEAFLAVFDPAALVERDHPQVAFVDVAMMAYALGDKISPTWMLSK